MNSNTDQELFWEGEFGDEYIDRNNSASLIASNTALFSHILNLTEGVQSVVEFGANVGQNLKALERLIPNLQFTAVEINEKAYTSLRESFPLAKAYHASILSFSSDQKHDLSFTKTVLIHINPDRLKEAYQALYESSSRYILVAEYYNPVPVEITYRGNSDKLFKRDFASEIMQIYSDLRLLDYGFVYKNDPNFRQDDITWFLMEKRNH